VNAFVDGILGAAGAIATLFVTRDSPNFEVVAGMVGVVVIGLVVLTAILAGRRWRR
jgi:hypothetical protein